MPRNCIIKPGHKCLFESKLPELWLNFKQKVGETIKMNYDFLSMN